MKRKRITKKEFSKRMTAIILAVALIDLQLTYVLAFLGRDTVETLAITLVTEIIAVVITYSLKAYFGKKAEEKTRLEEDEQNYRHLNGLEAIDYGPDEDN